MAGTKDLLFLIPLNQTLSLSSSLSYMGAIRIASVSEMKIYAETVG